MTKNKVEKKSKVEEILGNNKYVQYTTDGVITGFYCKTLHTRIPDNTIEVSLEEWAQCVNEPAKWRVDTTDKKLVKVPEISEKEHLKKCKINTINNLIHHYENTCKNEFFYDERRFDFSSFDLGIAVNLSLLIGRESTDLKAIDRDGTVVFIQYNINELKELVTSFLDFRKENTKKLSKLINKVNEAETTKALKDISFL